MEKVFRKTTNQYASEASDTGTVCLTADELDRECQRKPDTHSTADS